MTTNRKIYFASDFHLGIPNHRESLERERKVIRWLDEIKKDAKEIFLTGDLFDFWFEYKSVVPKGFVRLLGKIAEITDSGIPVHFFTGNHDMWMFDYLTEETGAQIHKKPVIRTFGGKKFFIAHGDGLGPGDNGYKFIKKVFANPVCQWLFARIHPNLGFSIARYWSAKSRAKPEEIKFMGETGEFLIIYAKEILKKEHFDYFIFGHRHIPIDMKIGETSRYINLGDWITHFTYAVYDGDNLALKKYV